MADYRLYFMDSDNHIRHALDLDCTDDDEAIRVVAEHEDGREMELWSGKRLVKAFPAKT